METTTIKAIFSYQNRRFRIPDYQRAYSWEEEHILQFIQDLKDATQSYYLGHFLFEKDSQAPNDLLIIDGQQRLTTCIILLSSLYQELLDRKSSGEVVAIDINNDIRHIYLRDLLKHTQRLTTVRDDNNFFVDEIVDRQNGIRHDLTTTSQKRIRDARQLFDEAFHNATLNDLESWHSLVENAECTYFLVPNKIKAAQIFAFQNDRGKDLSKLEVLKSYFILQLYLQKQSDDALDQDLKYLEEEISSIYKQVVKVKLKEDDILLYYWRSCCPHSKGFYSMDVVKEVKDYIKGIPKNEICGKIKAFVADVARSFRLIEEVEKPDGSAFSNLHYLDRMALAYPFIIRAHLNGASMAQLQRLARLLENVTFRSLLRGGRADIESRLNVYLSMNASRSYVETVVAGVINELRNNGWWGYWSDKAMSEYLAGWMYGNPVDNYLLWRYELHLCSQTHYSAPLRVGYKELINRVSIEHIAPQTPPDNNPVANGYGSYEDKDNPENAIESGTWLNRLGNLMLISQSHNSSIGNKPFKDKLASYGKDNVLNQQKQVAEFVLDRSNPVWDKIAIEKRQLAILEAAKVIWSLDGI